MKVAGCRYYRSANQLTGTQQLACLIKNKARSADASAAGQEFVPV
jgi:hypothetical protein